MTTVRSLFEDAVHYEDAFLAHYIFCLRQEGKVDWDDSDSILSEVEPDTARFESLLESNMLGICSINIYYLRLNREHFALVYAKSPEEATRFTRQKTGIHPWHCREIAPDHEIYYGNRIISFRDLKKEMNEFPCLVGLYDRSY